MRHQRHGTQPLYGLLCWSLFGGRQVEIHAALAIEPERQGAVYRIERRLPLFMLQSDEVERTTRHPVRLSRTQVVLILECNQINRLFVALRGRLARVLASLRPGSSRTLVNYDRRSWIGLIGDRRRARIAVSVVVSRVRVVVAVAVVGVTVIWIAVIVIIWPVRVGIVSQAEAEEIPIAAIEPAAETAAETASVEIAAVKATAAAECSAAAMKTTATAVEPAAVPPASALSQPRQYRQAADDEEPRYVAHMHAS